MEEEHLWQKQTDASAVAKDRSPESRRWHGSWWVCIAGGPPQALRGDLHLVSESKGSFPGLFSQK